MIIAPIRRAGLPAYAHHVTTIIEAGAHIGRDTIKLQALWPEATVYAFEPVPHLYRQLVERTKKLDQVHCYNIALSDHKGEETFYVSSGASSAVSSLYEPDGYQRERPEVSFEKTSITTTTLAAWAEEQDVRNADVMWLDMQGAEQKVLSAAGPLLDTIQLLVVEISLTERFKGAPSYDNFVAWLTSHGFAIMQQDEPRHQKVNLLCTRT